MSDGKISNERPDLVVEGKVELSLIRDMMDELVAVCRKHKIGIMHDPRTQKTLFCRIEDTGPFQSKAHVLAIVNHIVPEGAQYFEIIQTPAGIAPKPQ